MRRKSKMIKIGNVAVGGGAPVTVQSMTNTDTRNISATVAQISKLEKAGCEIIRCAVPDQQAAEALADIKKQITIPLIADIHFDYRLALISLQSGVDALRLNPGNIGSQANVRTVADAANDRKIPIRIGVNSGSLPKDILRRYNGPCAEAMVESAQRHIDILEKEGFDNIKISLKASDVNLMIEAYRMIAERNDYPLHLGVTEAGTLKRGLIKSAIGIGVLLQEGIGDTLRVSLTADPLQEVIAGWQILQALGLRWRGIDLISCPTCGRCQIDLISLAEQVENGLSEIGQPLKVAVMGCAVNGPGEAREADIGIAGGKGEGLLFRKGEVIRKVPENQLVGSLLE